MLRKSLIRITIHVASSILSGRKIKTSNTKKVLVNLGCGLHCLPDWINIDGSPTALFGSKNFSWINKILYKFAGSSVYYSFEEFNKIIKTCDLRFCDLRQGVPFNDESVDIIYTSHFLEHLNKKDGEKFIKECCRVLKTGGLIRIAVPDLDAAFKMYKEGKTEEMLNSFFYTSDTCDFHMHKYNYNFETLGILLKNTGFSDIQKRSYQKGECPDINFLDVYPEHSLYVEARK